MITRQGTTKRLPATINVGGCEVTVSTVAQAERYGWAAYVAPTYEPSPEELAANKKSLIAQIAAAARETVESQANAALQDQLYANYKSATPHQMVIEVIDWGKAIYLEAEMRKAQVLAGVADDAALLCDFSSFGEKPYTVYQLYVAGLVEL